jgi:hypothetical protein
VIGLHLLHRALARYAGREAGGFTTSAGVNWWELGLAPLHTAPDLAEAHAGELDLKAIRVPFPIRVDEHIAQVCFPEGYGLYHQEGSELYQQLILFDDLWASAQPDLANAILRYTRRWDVLTP